MEGDVRVGLRGDSAEIAWWEGLTEEEKSKLLEPKGDIMSESKHTPSEWKIDLIAYDKTDVITIYYEDFNGCRTNICTTLQTDTPLEEAEANAQLIVKAVNSHDALLDALNNMLIQFGGMADSSLEEEAFNAILQAKAAIEQAEKG